MDPVTIKLFYSQAESCLAGIRRSILVFIQDTSTAGDLATPIRDLNTLRASALEAGMTSFEELAALCERSLESLRKDLQTKRDIGARTVLDLIAQMEATLLTGPLRASGFFTEVSDLVDESFDNLAGKIVAETDTEDDTAFEIDEETLEIFRSEANELLENIRCNLALLTSNAENHEALWEIRRNAHTFKGAAGIVGLRPASALAHRVEDLLDRLAERRCNLEPSLIHLLINAAGCLEVLSTGSGASECPVSIDAIYAGFDHALLSDPGVLDGAGQSLQIEDAVAASNTATNDDSSANLIVHQKPPPTPIVRISLERLDDLLKISRNLLINRSAVAERFTEFTGQIPASNVSSDGRKKLEMLFETQRRLTGEMQERLLQIRMVRFGTLATRLNRAVNVTCQEENKNALLVIENEETEVDTLVIDALIEPLLHLLRNAVVHGIESPETRRLIGKPEKGTIRLCIDANDEQMTLWVSDDGRGISTAKLIEKAIQTGVITKDAALSIGDNEALALIFERGLTTAETLNLNAGRGVGMSIVRESVESRGGSIVINSTPQKGTSFTITLPLCLAKPDHIPLIPELEITADEPTESLPPLVLVVDDSASIRRQTSKIIEDSGLRCITAVDGSEALELLLSGAWEPDLILSDVEMPQIDGWEFLEYVKTDDNLGHIPVVLVTSLDSDEYRQKAINLGAADYIVKPFSMFDLDQVVEKYCRSIAV